MRILESFYPLVRFSFVCCFLLPFKVQCMPLSASELSVAIRGLRGGYSGRSGGSWSGRTNNSSNNRNGGNYNRNRSRNRSGMGTMGKVLGGLALGLMGFALLGMLAPGLLGGAACGACCPLLAGFFCGGAGATAYAASQQKNQNSYDYYNAPEYSSYQDGPFEDNVSRVKLEVDTLRQHSNQTLNNTALAVPTAMPFSGEYIASYIDGGKSRQANIQLVFTLVDGVDKMGGGCFHISGSGRDIDGTTTIEQGVANMDGTSWWVERTVSGEIGLRVLSRGKFDFTNHTFTGTWLSNTFQNGSYLSFQRSSSPLSDNNMPMPPTTNAPTVTAGTVFSSGNHTAPQSQYGHNFPIQSQNQPIVVGTVVEHQPTTTHPPNVQSITVMGQIL